MRYSKIVTLAGDLSSYAASGARLCRASLRASLSLSLSLSLALATLVSACGAPTADSGSGSGADAKKPASGGVESGAEASASGDPAKATRESKRVKALKPGHAPEDLDIDPRFRKPHWVFGRTSLMSKKGPYNHVHVAQGKTIRTLSFYKDNRAELLQTAIDLQEPHALRLDYAAAMFANFLFKPQQERVLLVGLGGGSMVHFLRYYFPKIKVEVVEIDPVVVEATRLWFAVDNDENTKIHVGDGIKFIQDTGERWDTIFMDVFLKPTAEGTNSSGIPEHAMAVAFLRTLGDRLTEGGVLVFHMHMRGKWSDDFKAIREAFPHTLRVKRGGSVVIFASRTPFPDQAELESRAVALDNEKGWPRPLAELVPDFKRD